MADKLDAPVGLPGPGPGPIGVMETAEQAVDRVAVGAARELYGEEAGVVACDEDALAEIAEALSPIVRKALGYGRDH